MLKGNELPAFPSNDRIMVKPDVPPEKEGVLWVPDVAKHRANKGVILHAGLSASDMCHDHEHRIGDRVWWGQFAGVIEEWSHITKPGDDSCSHDWDRGSSPGDRMVLRTCTKCHAEWLTEPILIMNVEDILANETAEERRRNGEFTVAKANTEDGKTQHVIRRAGEVKTNGTATSTMVNYGS